VKPVNAAGIASDAIFLMSPVKDPVAEFTGDIGSGMRGSADGLRQRPLPGQRP
jgi:hypothetical protein